MNGNPRVKDVITIFEKLYENENIIFPTNKI